MPAVWAILGFQTHRRTQECMHTGANMKGDRNRLSVDSVGSNQCDKIASSSTKEAPKLHFEEEKKLQKT